MRGKQEAVGTMSPFETYLRTGRKLAVAPREIESKFNPWHDPTTGRFTFAQTGTSGSLTPEGGWDGRGFTGGDVLP